MLNKLLYTGIASALMFAPISGASANEQGKVGQMYQQNIADQMETKRNRDDADTNGCAWVPGYGLVCG